MQGQVLRGYIDILDGLARQWHFGENITASLVNESSKRNTKYSLCLGTSIICLLDQNFFSIIHYNNNNKNILIM